MMSPGAREHQLWVSLYSYVRGICTGIIAKRSQRFAWLSNTILSRWPATGHIQFALAGALFRLGLGANSTTILSVATGFIAGLAFSFASC